MKTPYKVALLVVPLLLILIAGGVYGFALVKKERALSANYQAVFLTNGQVYFGKVRNSASQYVRITDIYYLQTRQALQETGEMKGKDAKPAPAEPELTLVKLGEELHGPTDEMQINRDQILFIEDLRSDGKVATAIARYKSGNK